jgi:hypothetical protein
MELNFFADYCGRELLIGVIRRRVFHNRDLIAELSGIANRRFNAGMRYETSGSINRSPH